MTVQITITIKDRCSLDIQHQGDAHVLEDCGMEAVELLAGYVDKIALVHAHNRECDLCGSEKANVLDKFACRNGIADPVVNRVVDKFRSRSVSGTLKYKTNLERNDLPNWAWVQHLQEELMDAVNYLEKIQVLAERGQG